MSICKPSEQYLGKLRERYRKARKKERGRILDEFVATHWLSSQTCGCVVARQAPPA